MYRSARLPVRDSGTTKIDSRRSIEGEKGKKKKEEEEEKREVPPSQRAIVSRGSPTRRRRPRSWAIFLPREETECLPALGVRSRQHRLDDVAP
ncbi:hypothetical protein BHM03_00055949, partial [Ensete ventricosum]